MINCRLVGNKMVPLTKEDLKQREIDAINFRNKKQQQAKRRESRQALLDSLKKRLSITDEDLDVLIKGV